MRLLHTPLSLVRHLPLSKDPACRKLAQREAAGRAYIACDEQGKLIRNTTVKIERRRRSPCKGEVASRSDDGEGFRLI